MINPSVGRRNKYQLRLGR